MNNEAFRLLEGNVIGIYKINGQKERISNRVLVEKLRGILYLGSL